MIPIPVVPRSSWIIAAVVAVIIAGVVANTYRLSAAVDREHANLVQCQSDKRTLEENVEMLTKALNDQNAAVMAWKNVADRATSAAETALAEVDRLSASRASALKEIETWKRAAGENECDATRRLLLEYDR